MLKQGVALALLLMTGLVTAADHHFRILHSEALGPSARIVPRAGPGEPEGAADLSFVAYGRNFELELKRNSRLLNKLPRAQRQALERYQLYRGRLKGKSNSWVRITRINSELHGAFWDGHDLYTIEPARLAAAQGATTIIYRLADARSDLNTEICGAALAGSAMAGRQTALADYQVMVAELSAAAEASEYKQLDVVVLGDVLFSGNFPDEVGAALARMNIVDGIFSEQVGVIIAVPELLMFGESDNPFTTSVAEDLLSELADYRNSHANIRAYGLTHLFTGRVLQDNIAGIAYLDSLCQPRTGVSLSKGTHDLTGSALVAAHEIGHSFGAVHDGEGVCAGTAQTYLMAPQINGSSTFSPCSRQQMAAGIQSASCIKTIQTADAAVSAPDSMLVYGNEPFDYVIDVISLESRAVENAVVTLTLPHLSFEVDSASVPGGSCAVGLDTVTCRLGTVPAEATRRIQMQLRIQAHGDFIGTVKLTASNDRNFINNEQTTQFHIDPRVDLGVSLNPLSITSFLNDQVTVAGTLTAGGIAAATGASVRIEADGMRFDSVTLDGNACSINDVVVCELGEVQPGETHALSIQLTGTQVGSYQISARIIADNDTNQDNNRATTAVQVLPDSDVALWASTTNVVATLNEPFEVDLTLATTGRQASTGIVISNEVNAAFTVESVVLEGADCTVDDNAFSCTLDSLAPDVTRHIAVTLSGTQVGAFQLRFNVSADNDQSNGNNSGYLTVEVKQAVDASLSARPPGVIHETREKFLTATVYSAGHSPTRNIEFTATFPVGVVPVKVSSQYSACSIADNVVTCTLDELGFNSTEDFTITVRGDEPGEYSPVLTVSADEDADDSNNSVSPVLRVESLVDASILVEQSQFDVVVDEPFDATLQVATDLRAVPGVRFTFGNVFSKVKVDSVQTDVGSCVVDSGLIDCDLGDLSANSVVTINMRLYTTGPGSLGSSARLYVDADVDSSNDSRTLNFESVATTEVSLAASADELTVTLGRNFTYSLDVNVTGNATASEINVDVRLPTQTTYVSADASSNCSKNITGFECTLSNISGGTTHQIRATLNPVATGSFSLFATATANNDTERDNNAHTTTVIIQTVATTPSASESKGGGGSLGWLMFFALYVLSIQRLVFSSRDAGSCP